MTRRRFYRRGHVVEIEEVDNLRARLAAPDVDFDERLQFEQPEHLTAEQAGLPEFASFEEAGWRLTRADERPRSVEDLFQAGPDQAGRRVYRDVDGTLLIGTGRLGIRLEESFPRDSVRQWLADRDLEFLRELPFAPNLVQVQVRNDRHELEVAKVLSEEPRVLYAEPEFLREVPQRWRPGDPEFSRQWQWGTSARGGIDAEIAWNTARGDGITVGVIDFGFDIGSPEIAGAVAGLSGAFVDRGEGRADFVPIAGLANYPNDPHGTFCAGMVAAQTNQILGVGAAPCAYLALVACLSSKIGTDTTLARAVGYLADPTAEGLHTVGADVIVCSLGPNDKQWPIGSVFSDALSSAASRGRSGRGTLVIWATSNGRQPVSDDEVCSHPKVFAVGRSTDRNTDGGTAFGPGLDVLAPGVGVYGVGGGSAGITRTGTSFAAPIVAGIAALLLEIDSTKTADDLRRLLESTADKIGVQVYDPQGWNPTYGFGRVNAARAISALAGRAPMAAVACAYR